MSADGKTLVVTQSNDHVYEYLNYYIDFPHPPHYAVLLDGPWGIGKTHLIKKFLKEKFGEDKGDYTYVSLFGLKSLSEIDEALFASAHPLVSSKGAKIVGRLAKAWLKYKHVEADLGVKDFFARRANGLFIFDDLERCEMKINEILGYINEFVEHDACKVVIVANEEEIKDEEYLRRREKIIGKTLSVESSFDEALTHFLSEIDDEGALTFLTSKKSEIQAIYILSGLNNLRVLEQTLWDFQRLYKVLTNVHKENDDAMTACVRLFFPLSMEFKSGRVLDDDLENRPTKIEQAFGHQSQNKTPPTRFEAAQGRYVGVDLSDTLLSDEVLEGILSNGVISEPKIRECLDNSSYFAKESEPAWRTVWYITERSDEDFKSALKEMEKQFISREFEIVGEMFHVFGIRLWLAVALGTTERFWLGLQADYDLEEAHRALGKSVKKIERLAA